MFCEWLFKDILWWLFMIFCEWLFFMTNHDPVSRQSYSPNIMERYDKVWIKSHTKFIHTTCSVNNFCVRLDPKSHPQNISTNHRVSRVERVNHTTSWRIMRGSHTKFNHTTLGRVNHTTHGRVIHRMSLRAIHRISWRIMIKSHAKVIHRTLWTVVIMSQTKESSTEYLDES